MAGWMDGLKNVNGVIFLNHEILLKQLEYFGFDYTAIAFFHSYLSNRKQQCNVNGASSELLDTSCEVPQGTILGPLLFLTYINDLPNCLESCTARLYADDTGLTIPGAQFHDIELYNRLTVYRSIIEPYFSIMMYKIVHGLAPPYMTDMFREQLGPKVYDLRNSKLNLEIRLLVPLCLQTA